MEIKKRKKVNCHRSDLLRLIYVKYQAKEINWQVFKRKVEAVMELESWLDSFVVDSKVYDRICWIEPANEMWREVLKLLKDGAFKKPDPKVITQKFKTYPNPKTRIGLEATEIGKTERLGKIIANNDKKNNLSSFI